MTTGKVFTRDRLLAAATGWAASDYYLQSSLAGPNDDAIMELADDRLLIAAREYVEAHIDERPVAG